MKVTREQFLDNVKNHTIESVVENGHHRDVVFSNAGSFNQRFRLVTWPGSLCFTGDMGTFVFCRLDDMFQFFRPRNGRWREEFNYWHEKLEAVDNPDGSKERSKDMFVEVLRSYIPDAQDSEDEDFESVLSIRDQVAEEIDRLSEVYDNHGFERAFSEASEFFIGSNVRPDFTFTDLWDHSFSVFTARFEWCCWAIQWGIVQYDAMKEANENAK